MKKHIVDRIQKLYPKVKLIIEYDPVEGKAITDSVLNVEFAFLLDALRNEPERPFVRSYGNMTMINKSRLLIVYGYLTHEEIVYYWKEYPFDKKDYILTMNEYAAWKECPMQFTSPDTKSCVEILRFASTKIRVKRSRKEVQNRTTWACPFC